MKTARPQLTIDVNMWYILREIDQNKEIKVKNEAKEKKKKRKYKSWKICLLFKPEDDSLDDKE